MNKLLSTQSSSLAHAKHNNQYSISYVYRDTVTNLDFLNYLHQNYDIKVAIICGLFKKDKERFNAFIGGNKRYDYYDFLQKLKQYEGQNYKDIMNHMKSNLNSLIPR